MSPLHSFVERETDEEGNRANKKYVEALTALETAEIMYKRMEGVDVRFPSSLVRVCTDWGKQDDTKTVLLSFKGIQTGKGSDLKEDVKKSKAKAVSNAEEAKPAWLKTLEQGTKSNSRRG